MVFRVEQYFCACCSEDTVTSISHPSFVSLRGNSLQSPIRSLGRLPVGLGSSKKMTCHTNQRSLSLEVRSLRFHRLGSLNKIPVPYVGSLFLSLPPPGFFGRLLFVPSRVSCGLQSPIRSRGRLPVLLGSSNKIPVPYKPSSSSKLAPLTSSLPLVRPTSILVVMMMFITIIAGD